MSSSAAMAPRTRAWSSASSSLIMGPGGAAKTPGHTVHDGTSTRTRKPGRSSRPPTVSVPPSASARRRRPRRPCPSAVGGAAAHAVVDDLHAVRAEPHRGVRRLAVPHDVGHRLPDRPGEQLPQPRRHLVGRAGQVGRHVRRGQRLAGGGDLARQRDPAHAQRGGPHVGQRVAGQPFQVVQLRGGPVSTSTSSSRWASSALTATTVSEWPRMSCRSRGDAGPLVLHRQLGQLALGQRPAGPGVPWPAGCPSWPARRAARPARTRCPPSPAPAAAAARCRSPARRRTAPPARNGRPIIATAAM